MKLCRTNIQGHKTWLDDNNKGGARPQSITINLMRDGEAYKTQITNAASNWAYNFKCLPIWKSKNKQYVYAIDEAETPEGYEKSIQGFNIINRLLSYGFWFRKISFTTLERLEGGVFEVRMNDTVIATAASDANGIVTFTDINPGTYELVETIAPPGYLPYSYTLTLVITVDGIVTINSFPAESIGVGNTPIDEIDNPESSNKNPIINLA